MQQEIISSDHTSSQVLPNGGFIAKIGVLAMSSTPLNQLRDLSLVLVLLFLIDGCRPSTVSDPSGDATQSFVMNGLVEQVQRITYTDLQKMNQHKLGAIRLTKGNGEVYLELEAATGILLKDILHSVGVKGLNNKNYSSYYVVCTATDGYKTLYSWNELFNSPLGDQAYLIMKANEQSLPELEESIMMVSLADKITGKRNLRKLESITVMTAI